MEWKDDPSGMESKAADRTSPPSAVLLRFPAGGSRHRASAILLPGDGDHQGEPPALSIHIAAFTHDASDDRQIYCAHLLHHGLRLQFQRWQWLDCTLEPCASRYCLQVSIDRFADAVSLSAELSGPQLEALSPVFSAELRYSGTAAVEAFHHSLLAELFAWLARAVFECEERLGERARWWSLDGRQNLVWAYLLWSRLTEQDNALARGLAMRALQRGLPDALQPRAYAVLAETYVEAIAYGWIKNLETAKKLLAQYAQQAREGNRRDPMTVAAYANYLSYCRSVDLAFSSLEGGIDRDALCLAPQNFLGLQALYRGDLALAEACLDPQLTRPSFDRLGAMGLQYLAQCKFFLGKYEEGITAATRALQINERSAPALRALAANLTPCGREAEARSYVQEARRFASKPFVTANYQTQPWQNRAAIDRYAATLHGLGVPLA